MKLYSGLNIPFYTLYFLIYGLDFVYCHFFNLQILNMYNLWTLCFAVIT